MILTLQIFSLMNSNIHKKVINNIKGHLNFKIRLIKISKFLIQIRTFNNRIILIKFNLLLYLINSNSNNTAPKYRIFSLINCLISKWNLINNNKLGRIKILVKITKYCSNFKINNFRFNNNNNFNNK